MTSIKLTERQARLLRDIDNGLCAIYSDPEDLQALAGAGFIREEPVTTRAGRAWLAAHEGE